MPIADWLISSLAKEKIWDGFRSPNFLFNSSTHRPWRRQTHHLYYRPVRHPSSAQTSSSNDLHHHANFTQSWVKFTAPSPVPAKSSLRLPKVNERHLLRTSSWCPQAMLTPRCIVEPQEKKKQPKGRAKKRITYTRRFVNVTMTGGKRKV